MFVVKQIFTDSPLKNYTYIVYSSKTGEAVCIDPYSAKQVIDYLNSNSLTLKTILNTHEHADHTSGNLELKEYCSCTVLGHSGAKGKIPGLDDILREDDLVFDSDGDSLVSWETPGHSLCHLSFVWKNPEKNLGIFTGDTVFNAGVGNCYRGGDVGILYKTIRNRFETLSGDVLLFPGHEYLENNLQFAKHIEPENRKRDSFLENPNKCKQGNPDFYLVTNFEIEREINPFFRRNSPSLHKKLGELSFGNPRSSYDDEFIFTELRKYRDSW
ncbi:MAG: hydroxyacylglutathione hydrolase [Leptospira sp.]|nr:hydroxyacylglutathione hydrolase [Leptospira sp.]